MRSLLAHLRKFIDAFEGEVWVKKGLKGDLRLLFQKQLVKRPEYRKLVRQFNEVCNEISKTSSCFIVQLGTDLMKFELEVEREQKNPKIRRVEKMLAQPILKMKEESNQLIVNFDPRLVMMLRENERLCKLDIAMPR